MTGTRGRTCRGLLLALIGSQALGCGGNPYRMAPVRGRVTCQGKPAAGGPVVVQALDVPPRARPASGPARTVRDKETVMAVSSLGKTAGLACLAAVWASAAAPAWAQLTVAEANGSVTVASTSGLTWKALVDGSHGGTISELHVPADGP